jgi:FkbM family methyltransferase
LIKAVAPSQLPGLATLFIARMLFRVFRLKLCEGICLSFRGISLYLRPDFPSGLTFVRELIVEGAYRDFRTDSQTPHCGLLDIGANIGLLSLERCRSNSALRSYCLEPHPETFALLATNIALNKLSDRVHACHLAASDHDGSVKLAVPAHGNMGWIVGSNALPGDYVIDVPCSTVDTFCLSHGIRPEYLKIDVEGHEAAVLAGAMRTLRGVTGVVIECHSDELRYRCEKILLDCDLIVSSTSGLLLGQRA